MATTKAPTVEDIKGGFPHQRLTPIIGEPTFESIDRLEKECIRNASTVECRLPAPHTNLCGYIEQPGNYLLRVGAPFPPVAYPGDVPNFPARANQAVRDNTQAVFNMNLRLFLTCQRLETILSSMIENAIDNIYLAGIHSETHGFGARRCGDIIAWLYQTYGKISTHQLAENQARLSESIPSDKPITMIFDRIEKCQKIATAGGTPLTAEQVVKAAETLVVKMGRYNAAYREWIRKDPADKTYANFKTFFTAEYQVQNQLNLTTDQAGYNTVHYTADDTFNNNINQLAQAAVTNNETVTALAESNANLQYQMEQMAEQNQQLQQLVYMALNAHIDNPNMAQANAATAFPPPPPHNPYSPQFRRQAPPQQPHGQLAHLPPTPVQPRQPRGRGRGRPPRRMGTRGRGRGRYNIQANNFYNNGRGNFNNVMQYNNTAAQNPPSIYKRYNNWNYCFTCGFDVEDWHDSSTCTRPCWNHNVMATRNNTMGGSTKGQHRYVLPGQNPPNA